MKKIYTILTFLLVMFLTGCSFEDYEYEIKENPIQATVISCEENFYTNYMYEKLARDHADSYIMHNYYMNLAIENGYYDYSICVDIEGKEYNFIRKESVEVGEEITLIRKDTYISGQLVETKIIDN